MPDPFATRFGAVAMPYKIAEITAKLTIDLMRITMVTLEGQRPFKIDPAAVMLCAAIFMGQAQGRPMTAAKAATYVRMARSTAIRRLTEMKAVGIVDVDAAGRWVTVDKEPMNAATIKELTDEKARLIRKAAAELSKMDGRTIADKTQT